jgi:uncharacterized protein YjbI with pentapeptide repeats
MFDIESRWTLVVLYHSDTAKTVSAAVTEARNNGADLSGAQLSGSDLRCSNLEGVQLSGGDLRGSNLSGANLSGANLSGSNLSGSNLSGADLAGANLRGSDLTGANLRGTHLCGAYRDEYKIGIFCCISGVAEWGDMLAIVDSDGALHIEVGKCQHHTPDSARKYWQGQYNRDMTLVALSMAELWHADLFKQ